MVPQTRKHFLIIVHHGSPNPTSRLIDSLLSSTPTPARIVVVDHSKKPYVNPHPNSRVHVIRPQKNSGYAGGIAVGLGYLTSQNIALTDVISLLNNDLVISSDTLAKLDTWWQAHPKAAIAGLKYGIVNLLTGRANILPVQTPPHTSLNTFVYLHGSFLSAPAGVFMRLQGLPVGYFLYWEDILFTKRARQLNLPLRVIPNLGITHNDTIRKTYSDSQLYYLVRNGALFLAQETALPWRFYWHILNVLRLVYHTCFATRPVIRHALLDALRNQTGPRPPAH